MLTFKPKVILQCFSQCHSPFIIEKRIIVDGDSSYPWHTIQVRSAVSQAVFPCFCMSPGGLMLCQEMKSMYNSDPVSNIPQVGQVINNHETFGIGPLEPNSKQSICCCLYTFKPIVLHVSQ